MSNWTKQISCLTSESHCLKKVSTLQLKFKGSTSELAISRDKHFFYFRCYSMLLLRVFPNSRYNSLWKGMSFNNDSLFKLRIFYSFTGVLDNLLGFYNLIRFEHFEQCNLMLSIILSGVNNVWVRQVFLLNHLFQNKNETNICLWQLND